jgi:DNA-binding FadR family transcriptional regulator
MYAAWRSSMSVFKPAKQNRVFEDVVEQIQDAILSGQFKPGDILPSERDLREVFKVSRGTIREALRILEQKGLIEIKLGVGGGAIVKEASIDAVSESLDLLIRHQKVSMSHLAEFRIGMEGDMAAIAVMRATPKEIEELEKIMKRAQSYCDGGPDYVRQFLEADMQFHQALSKITKNPMYEVISRIIHENILSYYTTFIEERGISLKENCKDFSRIVEAMKKKHPEEARAIIREHITRYASFLEKKKDKKGSAKN